MLSFVVLGSDHYPLLAVLQQLCWLLETAQWEPEELLRAGFTQERLNQLEMGLRVLELLAEGVGSRDGAIP